MAKPKDLEIGSKFWKLTVIARTDKRKNAYCLRECRCDCWNTTLQTISNLRLGRVHSCWCLGGKVTHWMTWTTEMHSRTSILKRCNDVNSPQYVDYWARGIKVWFKNFEEFYEEIWPKPWPEYSVDRIDNNKGYEKWNVRWATMKQQSNNRRSNVKCIINWEEHTLQERADKLWINRKTLKRHILNWKIRWELYNYTQSEKWK